MRPYTPLFSKYHDSTLPEEDDPEEVCHVKQKPSQRRIGRPSLMLIASIILNAALTVVLLIFLLQRTSFKGTPLPHADNTAPLTEPITPFAGLARNISKPWSGNTFTTPDAWEALWNSTPFWPGIISLPDSYARAKGLPRAQRFPWDPARGIYVLNAYHNLHCVLNLRAALEEYRDARPQTVAWPHLLHCLLVLRDQILCDADDTPRYTGFQPQGSSGVGQTRLCRDWAALEAWATRPDRESCWRNVDGVLGDRPHATDRERLDRYRFCSSASPYQEMAETAWRDEEDWKGLDVVHSGGEA